MARLTYATLALALASLVSGFFVRTTAVPLFASIGLSALVLLLILRGWARRIRQEPDFTDEPEPVEDLDDLDLDDIVLVDPDDVSEELPSIKPKAVREPRVPREPKESREPRERPRTERAPAKRGPRAAGGRVVVLPGRTRYHIPGCRFAHGKGAEEISEAAARRRRFQPCSVCLGA